MGIFITFEGGEGSGKSYHSKVLYRHLLRHDIPALLTHEPGGTFLGDRICRLLKWNHTKINPTTELLLFNASRSQLVSDVIKPALDSGKVVVCDRYIDSTIAYQGYGRGVDLDRINIANSMATGGLFPDLTIFLDIPPEAALARKIGEEPDRFHKENMAFHRRIYQGYWAIINSSVSRFLVVDAQLPKRLVSTRIRDQVSQLLRQL